MRAKARMGEFLIQYMMAKGEDIMKRRDLRGRAERRIAALFLLPSLIGIFCLNLIPTCMSLSVSLTDWVYTNGIGNWNFVGLANFKALFSDSWFIKSLTNTLLLTIVVVPVGIFLSLVIAALIDTYCSDKVAGVVRVAMYIPNICNIVAVCAIWMALYSSYGPFTNLVRSFGFDNPPRWLADFKWALPAIMLVTVWAKLGYNVFIYGAAMAALPRDVYESAELDGANGRQQFFNLTIPLLSNTTFFLTVTGIIISFQTFGYVNVMTKGGPVDSTYVLVFYIYKLAFDYMQTGYASAVAVVLFLILLVITIIQYTHNNKEN